MSMPYVKCLGPERFQMWDFWNVFIREWDTRENTKLIYFSNTTHMYSLMVT